MGIAKQSEYKIVIIGAGPVGLTTALLLARRGLPCLLVDRRTENLPWSKAIGITPPSLKVLTKVGLADELVSAGVRITEAYVHDDRGTAGCVRFDNLACDHNFILALPQSETLVILGAAGKSEPLIERLAGVEMCGMVQDSSCARLRLKSTDGGRAQDIAAEWVLGCDGADSGIRDMAGVRSRRKTYRQHFVMADFEDATDWGPQAHLFFTRHGSLESFPLPLGRRRWVALVEGRMETEEAQARLQHQIARIGGCDKPGNQASAIFQFRPERIDLDRLHSGRTALAGDAAHVMSPIGGQGMNTGIADAELLSAVVARILEGEYPQNLLASYSYARQRAARAATRRAAVGMWVGTRTGRLQSRLRSALLRRVLLRPPTLDRLSPHFAMLNLPSNQLREIS